MMKSRGCRVTFPLALFPLVHLFLAAFSNESTVEVAPETLGLVLFGAVCEELFFRSFLQNQLRERFVIRPLWIAILVNLLFAAAHVVNAVSYATAPYVVLQTVTAFGVGLSLSAVYERTGKIGYCILIHTLINATGLLAGFALTEERMAVYALTALAYAGHGIWLLRQEETE